MHSEPQFLADTAWSLSAGWWLVVAVLLVLAIALRWRRFNIGVLRQNVEVDKVALRLLASHKAVQIYSVEINGERFVFVQSAQALLQLDPGKASVLMSNTEAVNEAGK